MTLKASHLLSAMCAVVALSAFSGTASADCLEIQNFVKENKDRVTTALFNHFGDDTKRAKLRKAVDEFQFMTLSSRPVLKDVKGCTVTVELTAAKEKPNANPTNPIPETRSGSVTMNVGFVEDAGLQLCIKTNRVLKANWRHEHDGQDKRFIKSNAQNPYFGGCLF